MVQLRETFRQAPDFSLFGKNREEGNEAESTVPAETSFNYRLWRNSVKEWKTFFYLFSTNFKMNGSIASAQNS